MTATAPPTQATQATEIDWHRYDAGDVELQSGRTFRRLFIAYKTFGTLNADKSNVIVYPTSYSAQHHDTQFMVSPGGASTRTSTSSSSPTCSATACPVRRRTRRGPMSATATRRWTYFDAVQVQRRMLRELLGHRAVALVYGWSMGAMQATTGRRCFAGGRAHRGRVRRGALRAAQPGVHRGRTLCADRRPRVPRRGVH
ncbi:MAG: hypothetical protein R3E68_15765 [Burkholderiaceae bacterium]